MGTFYHNIDVKGRMNFPTRMREILGENFVITKGPDSCLFVYSLEGWAELEAKLNAQPLSKGRNIQRFFFAGAVEVEPDKQGRINIPQHLREYAGLEKDVVVIGASGRAEIWDKAKYDAANNQFSPDMLFEAMDELGI